MPRYFFDIHDERDEHGTICEDLQAAALEAKRLLPEIVTHEIPRGGEPQIITVLVSDEERHAVYSAALCFVGTWLLR